MSSLLPARQAQSTGAVRWAIRIILVTLTAAFVSAAAWLAVLYWPRPFPPFPRRDTFIPVIRAGVVEIEPSGCMFVGTLARFDDELFAFLMFDYYRSARALRARNLYLTSTELRGKPEYRILLGLPPSLIQAIEQLAELKHLHLTENFDWRCAPASAIPAWQRDTAVFLDAWTAPTRTTLSRINRKNLVGYLRRFIRFKSLTDPRIEKSLDPIPSPLSKNAASQLAADIIDIADFFHLPLELLLGIGAMENNYMNVPGDLQNTAWKRRPDPGDVVLRRRKGRVLVRNDSQGVWQITRESLRYAHRLYLTDTRDYSALPQRLRLPPTLDIDHVTSDQLTTYAGLLLRDLLDRFHGDVILAAGAYNGGVDKPNEKYAAGVELVAAYARRVLANAAARNAEKVRESLPRPHD